MLDKEVIKVGFWLYDGSVTTEVRIVGHATTYGSGDYEVAEEVREDRHDPSFSVEWGSPGERGVFRSKVGNFQNLNSAIRHVEDQAPTVIWSS